MLFCLGASSVGMREAEYRHLTVDLTLAIARQLLPGNPQDGLRAWNFIHSLSLECSVGLCSPGLWTTSNPQVSDSSVGLVPTNALVLTDPINSRMVNSEAPQKRRSRR
jgi:hypothetical protein